MRVNDGEYSLIDPNWDGLWNSAAKITVDGWTATLDIPFSTLNFRGSSISYQTNPNGISTSI